MMNLLHKPKSQLTGDKHTFYFPIVCRNCDRWFPSIGDCRKHLEQCISSKRHLLCGHCEQQWTDWPAFVQHLNVKGMSYKQPCSAQYSWQHTGRLQNFLPLISSAPRFSTADVLQSAVSLPTVYSRIMRFAKLTLYLIRIRMACHFLRLCLRRRLRIARVPLDSSFHSRSTILR